MQDKVENFCEQHNLSKSVELNFVKGEEAEPVFQLESSQTTSNLGG